MTGAMLEEPPAVAGHEVTGPAGAPVVVVLGGVSSTRHVTPTPDAPEPGWWDSVVGPSAAIDTGAWRVVGVDHLDGGSDARGRPARVVTTHDQADAVAAALDEIGVARVHAIVGASYGGMVALAFGERYPERVGRLVVVSAAHESHAMSTAHRVLQRRVVELGLDVGRGAEALAIARGFAMTTYRTALEFEERFGAAHRSRASAGADAHGDPAPEFPVGEYLAHVGAKYAALTSPARFLALSLSADLHRVDPAAVRTPTVLVASEGDALVPESQTEELAARLAGPVRLERMATRYGHDAFLTEPAKVGRILTAALRGEDHA